MSMTVRRRDIVTIQGHKREQEQSKEGQGQAAAVRPGQTVLMNTYVELANLRAWELAHRIIARIQRDSDFFHFWHYWAR